MSVCEGLVIAGAGAGGDCVLLGVVVVHIPHVAFRRVGANRGAGHSLSQLADSVEHRQYTADNYRRAGVDDCRVGYDLGEVGRHAARYAAVLVGSERRQFAEASARSLCEGAQFGENIGTQRSQNACALGFRELFDGNGIVLRIDEPARAVAPVMLDMERLISDWSRRQRSDKRVGIGLILRPGVIGRDDERTGCGPEGHSQ